MGKPLRVLIIEDSEVDSQLLLRELQRVGYDVEFERVDTDRAMRVVLSEKTWDLILSDYSLPRFDAPLALEVLKASGLDVPFIIISGTIGEETAIAALKAGADDFIVKGKFARLGPAIERELREAESRRERRRAEEQITYHARLLRHISDAVIATDDQFRITAWNRAAETTYGWTAQEVLGRSVIEILRSGLNDAQQAEARELLSEMSSFRNERIHAKKNGQPVYVEENTIALTDEHGKITGYVSVNRDITQRRQTENKLGQHVERLTALREIDQVITSTFDMELSLNTLLSRTITLLAVDASAILLLNPIRSTLEYRAGTGFRTNDIRTTSVKLNESYAGRVAVERKIIKRRNLAEAPDAAFSAGFLQSEGFVSYAGAPLIVKGKVIGVLEVFNRSTVERDQEWLDFFSTLAGQAAIAIDNAQLFNELQASNIELSLAYDATIRGWSRALDLRDKETEGHTQRVTDLTMELASRIGFPGAELIHIQRGSLLHDIGKMGVPDHILLKPGPLTDEEWAAMKKHTDYAYEMLSPIRYLQSAALDIPYSHHEKWDGSGYPRGLKGDQIPLAARIFSIVDVWDALTSDRPYRAAWTKEATIEYIRDQSGKHFDPRIVEAFLQLIVGWETASV